MELRSKVPSGPIDQKWTKHKFDMKLVNPANKRKYHVIVVGSGLAGASASATLAELGYRVSCFTYHDSPRRAHSISAQGGINAAKNYQGDGDSIFRLFYDTVKGGDFRAQVSRTFYARGQTGQQLLLGAYQALMKEVHRGQVKLYNQVEMLDVIVVDGQARGIVTRHLVTGKIETHLADAVALGTGGYANAFYLSTNAMYCNVTAAWRAYRRGAGFANPCYTQIHPTCIPMAGDYQSKLTLMSESLRNDGRIWVSNTVDDDRAPGDIPEDERDYYLDWAGTRSKPGTATCSRCTSV